MTCCWRVTGKPHLTLVSVSCCSRARVCLDRRSETQIFVDPGAFIRTYPDLTRFPVCRLHSNLDRSINLARCSQVPNSEAPREGNRGVFTRRYVEGRQSKLELPKSLLTSRLFLYRSMQIAALTDELGLRLPWYKLQPKRLWQNRATYLIPRTAHGARSAISCAV